jgi:putative ABC transport system permease protein
MAGIDRNLPLYDVKPLATQVNSSLWQQRTAAGLIGIFGALSLLIAGAGLYSVMAYAVSQRTREYGIRIALGARQGDVLGLVMRNAMKLALTGVVLGAMAALVLNRFVAGFLYGVAPTDILTYSAVMLLLVIVAAAASYQPARAATRIDPLAALRHD